ncbi:MAG: RnfABCDGE type electron transport complex subunit B [Elusimicrobia bacterium]|nr:RnfABCDGE type electron transport complex subunit B [Elusimicrobiota bacterium]MBD3412449.1 RnfABCDGE type electron transport complex subunit B [Elusimicrobiota bacterium]
MIVTAVITFGLMGLIIGILLAVANRFLQVTTDPREERVLAVLPGINCGACSYPGCAAYAAAVVQEHDRIDKCIPGGMNVAQKIGAIMGATVGPMEKRVARVLCNGGRDKSPERFRYSGISSCAAVQVTSGGNKACTYGCLGLGDCKNVCPFDAIIIREDGIAYVLEDKCTACGRCVAACPRGIISIIPKDKRVIVACSSKDPGPETKRNSKVGCIACRICVKKCPSQAITVENNLARINPDACTLAQSCIAPCPMHTIIEFKPQ